MAMVSFHPPIFLEPARGISEAVRRVIIKVYGEDTVFVVDSYITTLPRNMPPKSNIAFWRGAQRNTRGKMRRP